MQAIILAGGLGTRLRSSIGEYPKPMADINGEPFLAKQLRWLATNEVSEIVLAVSYKWEIIRDYFGAQFEGMSISYSVEQSPLGTGGAVKQALRYLSSEKHTLIVNGDTYFPCALSTLYQDHLSSNPFATIGVKQIEDSVRYGSLVINDAGQVTSFKEKSVSGSALINAGIYVLNKEESNLFPDGNFSLEEFYQNNCDKIVLIARQLESNIFIDIGIPEDYEKAKRTIA